MSQWFQHTKRADFKGIGQALNISPIIVRIMRNRDIESKESMSAFLYGNLNDTHSPWLLKDMERAVDIILDLIKNNKKIRIIGDYDVDGICSTYILIKGLRSLGAVADYDIPDRIEDGYGLNVNLVKRAIENGVEAIITCDNGIAAVEAIDYAKKEGMTVVVTDHHNPQAVLPDADALIDQKQPGCAYPYKEICGAVVALKLISACFEKSGDSEKLSRILYSLTQFAGFATVCDVVELKNENRIYVKEALKLLNLYFLDVKTDKGFDENIGIRALMQVCELDHKQIYAYTIGFVLGPCMNASGRLDSAKKALRLLETEKYDEALELAKELRSLNEERKELTQKGVENAFEIVESSMKDDKILVVYLPDCHESIAGIVAGRVREKYYKPTIVLTQGEGCIKGSGRSIDAYDMFFELEKQKELFEKFGGHKKAAGLTLKKSASPLMLRVALNGECDLKDEELVEKKWIDSQLPFEYANVEFIESLDLLEPFGMGNEKPCFAEKNLKINRIGFMGKDGMYMRLTLENERGFKINAVCFKDKEAILGGLEKTYGRAEIDAAVEGKANSIRASILFYPSINEFRGNKEVQLVIEDIN